MIHRYLLRKITVLFCLSTCSHVAMADHASIGLRTGQASPIGTETAVPLPGGSWSAGLRSEFVDFNDSTDRQLIIARDTDPEGDIHSVDNVIESSAGVAYGVTDDFTVGLRLPYVIRNGIREPEHGDGHGAGDDDDHHDDGPPENVIESLGDADGLGDLTVFGQYRFFHQQETKSHAALLFGVKMPTGNTGVRIPNGGLFETEFQPGSGSWDGLIGLAGTQILGQFALNASALYSIVSEGSQSTDLGDVFSYNLALSYRLGEHGFHANYIEGERNVLDLILELNGEWRDKETIATVVDGNSGSNIIYISPGFRFAAFQQFNVAFSFGYPIVKDMNGFQVAPNYRLVGTISANF